MYHCRSQLHLVCAEYEDDFEDDGNDFERSK